MLSPRGFSSPTRDLVLKTQRLPPSPWFFRLDVSFFFRKPKGSPIYFWGSPIRRQARLFTNAKNNFHAKEPVCAVRPCQLWSHVLPSATWPQGEGLCYAIGLQLCVFPICNKRGNMKGLSFWSSPLLVTRPVVCAPHGIDSLFSVCLILHGRWDFEYRPTDSQRS